MRRLNLPLLIVLALLLVGGTAGVALLHRYQLRRNAESMAVDAQRRLEEGREDEAIALLGKYLALRPADTQRQRQYAELLLRQAESGRATARSVKLTIAAMETAMRAFPEDDALRERFATFLFAANQPGPARDHFEILLQRSQKAGAAERVEAEAPDRAGAAAAPGERLDAEQIAVRFAITASSLGRFDEAENVLSGLVDFDPVKRRFPSDPVVGKGTPAAFLALAHILEEQRGDERAAAAVVERLATIHPDDKNALQLVARWHVGHRDADAAGPAIDKARALAPDDVDLAFLDYQTAMMRGDTAKAAEILAGPLSTAEPVPPIVLARSGFRQRQGDVDGAIEILRGALEQRPEEPLFHTAILSVLADAGRIDQLREQLAVSRPKVPKTAEILLYADALIAIKERRWLEAQRLLEELRPRVARDKQLSRQIDVALADCHRALGQFDQANEARRRALTSSTGVSQALFLEMDELEREGRLDEALAMADALTDQIGKERLLALPQFWDRLFRLKMAAQVRQPAEERDWTAAEALLDAVAAQGKADPAAVARRRVDLVSARADVAAALEASAAALEAHPGATALLGQRVMLLVAAERVAEARELLDGMPEETRDSPDVIEAALRIAALLPGRDSAAWLADVERRLDRLEDPVAARCAQQLVAIHFGRGASNEAERIALRAVDRDPDNLPLQSVLLDLAAERNDPEATARQAEVLVKLTGAGSPTAHLAQAVEAIVGVRAARLRRFTSQADVRLTDGEKADLERARSLLALAGNARPRWADVPRQLAAIDELEDDYGAAIGRLRQACEYVETLPFGRRRLAYLLILTGRSEEARPVLQSLGPAAGIHVERLRAEKVAESGRVEDARRLAAALTPDDCVDADQWMWYASLLTRCRDLPGAVKACRRAIDAAPSSAAPWMTLVGIHLAGGDEDAAREAAAEARQRLDGEERTRFDTIVTDRLDDPEALEARYRAAVETDPADAEAAKKLVAQLLSRQKGAQAQEELRRFIAAERPGAAPADWARRLLARQLAPAGYRELLEALALLRRNVDSQGKQHPEDILASIALLAPRNEPASWRQAVALLDELAARRPLTVDERVILAGFRVRLGKRDAARDELVAIASSPSASIAVTTRIAELLLDDDDARGARKWIERLRGEAPDAVPTLLLSARLAKAEGNDAQAEQYVRRLIPDTRLTAANARAMADRALAADAAGFHEAADRVLLEYAKATPEGTLLRARTLARKRPIGDALAQMDSVFGKVSPAAFLETLSAVVRQSSGEITAEQRERISGWLARLDRENPDAADVAIQVATLEEALGMTDEAERRYRALLAGERLNRMQTGVVAANLGWILARPEHAAEAAELVDRAVQIVGPISELLDTRALVRLANNQRILALEDIRDALLVPSAQKYLHLAVIQAESGDLDAAAEALQEARSLGLEDERLSADDATRLESLGRRLEPVAGGA
ncbi:MAG: tetratricopeptide repeat protein [Planctomycetaceae bacterium]